MYHCKCCATMTAKHGRQSELYNTYTLLWYWGVHVEWTEIIYPRSLNTIVVHNNDEATATRRLEFKKYYIDEKPRVSSALWNTVLHQNTKYIFNTVRRIHGGHKGAVPLHRLNFIHLNLQNHWKSLKFLILRSTISGSLP